ncbi:MAG: cytochrome oxidase putative small subunit CydP [Arenicellales bacterium]
MNEQHRVDRRARPASSHRPLAREIAVVLTVKLLALTLLWFAFFRVHPPADPSHLLGADPSHYQELP